MCPSLKSIHLHLILPVDFETADPKGLDMTELTSRIQRSSELVASHPNLKKVMVSAQKPAPAGMKGISIWGHGLGCLQALSTLGDKYDQILKPLLSLPDRIDVAYGARKPEIYGFNAFSVEGYDVLCDYILYLSLDKKKLASRIGAAAF
jgi:hypothetical protein